MKPTEGNQKNSNRLSYDPSRIEGPEVPVPPPELPVEAAPVSDGLVDIEIDLAPNANVLTIAGMQFWHGRSYRVSPDQAQVIHDMMYRTWKHEDDIHGRNNENEYRRPMRTKLGGR